MQGLMFLFKAACLSIVATIGCMLVAFTRDKMYTNRKIRQQRRTEAAACVFASNCVRATLQQVSYNELGITKDEDFEFYKMVYMTRYSEL